MRAGRSSLHRWWRNCGLPVAATVAALLVHAALTPWVDGRPTLVLFVIPIVVCAYAGGTWPGLLTTALVGITTSYFLMHSPNEPMFTSPADVVHWAILILAGILAQVAVATGFRHADLAPKPCCRSGASCQQVTRLGRLIGQIHTHVSGSSDS